MEFELEVLGRCVRERREALGLTQEELGKRAGYGAGAGVSISRIEAGVTRPKPDKMAGIALALGATPAQLEADAATRSFELGAKAAGSAESRERIKVRVRRIQAEVEHRRTTVTRLGNEFNKAHDRARDEFLLPFIRAASEVEGAPEPNTDLLDDEGVEGVEGEAAFRLRFATYGVAKALAGGAGGVAVGGAVGGAAAYGAFAAAVSFGTASTGVAISGLSGVAATNAALALLGGGTLASGGAGVAGGTLLLTGLVVAPALLAALGAVAWVVKRNRQQQEQLLQEVINAETALTATERGFRALAHLLPQATTTLEYIANHGGHAVDRWIRKLPEGPLHWDRLDLEHRNQYEDFVAICASQLAVGSIDVDRLMTAEGAEREALIEFADEMLTQSMDAVQKAV